MKLRTYIFSMLAAGALFACSSDDINIDKPSALQPDAYLSLNVKDNSNSILAKSGQTEADKQDVIKDLTVAVFDNSDKLHAIKKAGTDAVEVTLIPVKSGTLKVLALVNVLDKLTETEKAMFDAIPEGGSSYTLNDFVALTTSLEKEENGYLTMSSAVISIVTEADHNNCLGYSLTQIEDKETTYNPSPVKDLNLTHSNAEITREGIKVYRTPSRVTLSKLTVLQDTDFGRVVGFKLDSVFMASVKASSNIASTSSAGWNVVEKATDFTWFDGAAGSVTGKLKTHVNDEADNKGFLLQEHNTIYPFAFTSFGGASYKSEEFDYFFYVYENGQVANDGDKTLLVVRGDYTYIPQGFENDPEPPTITVEDGYWVVTVNDGVNVSFGQGTPEHKYVKRNMVYDIQATVVGPGSKGEFDPEARTHLAAKVVVADWNLVNMGEVVVD
ncbi:hypothetical protein LJC57_09795 [Parabacteroides sp. OttesenSCG-928-G07]|nr:hypothetical protein [Parabacteroides sp. OttesenSCG-928-G07]